MRVLLLNADSQPLSLLPLSTITWQSAVKAHFQDKVHIVTSNADRMLRSPSFEMPMPTVVMLKRWHKLPPLAKFTRRNLFLRDNFTCQYCFTEFKQHELTIDHVRPRSHGGKSNWTNCTTACKQCNWQKSNNPDVKPIRLPIQPSYYQLNSKSTRFLQFDNIHPDWQPYLFWREEKLESLA